MNNSIDRASTSATDKPEFSGEWVRLGDICNVRSGGTPKRSVSEYWDKGTIPWVKIGDISSKYISATEENISEAGLKNSAAKLFQPGTLLFSIFASIGAVGILTVPAATNQAIAGLEIKSNIINRDYLFYFLKASEMSAKHSGRGVAQNNINLSILRDMKVPVPSLAEQSAIAREFERIDCQIDNANNQLSSLDALVKSRFNEMFGDLEHGYKCPSRKLESIAQVGSSKRVFKNELLAEGIPFYRGAEIAELSAGGVVKPSLFISKEHYERLIDTAGKPEIGDLLLPSICPEGQIWCVNTDVPFYFKDGRVLWIRPNRDAVDGVYLRHALSTMFQMSFSNIASGTTFAELKIFLLKELEIPLPELKAQKEFVSFVRQVDKLRFDVQQQIDKLELLKSSLMQEYFG